MKKILFTLIIGLICINSNSQIIQNSLRLADIDKMFEVQKKIIGDTIYRILDYGKNEDEKLALKFLYAYMPLSDLADYNVYFFLENIKTSLKARKELPWGKSIPEDEFLHFVLPVRVNNENLDAFRIICYEELKARVKGLSLYDAALEVNHWCHEKVTYRGSDSRTSSPLSTLRYSFGRCGEESVFTVATLRTVGIPARQVYTPRWAHSDDNHAWVEVWIDGKWFFLGACEPEPELNMGWFAFPASRTMLVHTRAYGKYFGTEEIINDEMRFSELNLIKNYAEIKKITVLVLDSANKPIQNANVDFSIYNYAEFYPIARKLTDAKGLTSISLGLGELIIWVSVGNNFDFKHVNVSECDTVKLQIKSKQIENKTYDYNFTPPTGKFVAEFTGNKANQNKQRLNYEDSIRSIYMSTFKDTSEANKIAIELGYNKNDVSGFIVGSYGNYPEIISFLKTVPANLHNLAVQLLTVISEKDLRDITSDELMNHLLESPSAESLKMEANFYANYILNPRISYEKITAWRGFLKREIKTQIPNSEITAEIIIEWIKNNIQIDNKANLHSRAPITPIGVYNVKVADNISRNIFFVALCRSFGIAARLNPETEIPQYFTNEQWKNVWFTNENSQNVNTQSATIEFVNSNKNKSAKYTNSFTLSRFTDGRFRTLEYPESKPLAEFEGIKNEVFVGEYLLVTGNRLSDGTVTAKLSFFDLKANENKKVDVVIREIDNNKTNFGKVKFGKMKLKEFETNMEWDLQKSLSNKGMLLVFINPDKEPSKHVMHDLALVAKSIDEWEGTIFYVLSPENLSPAFTSKFFKGLPKQGKFLIDKDNLLFKNISKNQSKSLPLVCLIAPESKILFMSDGYRIGIGDEILKILNTKK